MDNSFDDEKTIFIDPQSEQGEENILFFLTEAPDNKVFLKSGEALTVGRSIESDFFIENKTISRKHLTLKREGGCVNIEIHGRNGLYMENELHVGSLQNIALPASFTIGDVPCSLEFEIDEDETIIVTADQRAGMINRPQAQPQYSPPPEPEAKKSFDPSPKDTFIPSDTPVLNKSVPENRTTYPSPDIKKQQFPPPEPSFEQPPSHMGQASFEPVPKDKNSVSGEKQNIFSGFTANKSNLIIAGIIGLSVLIIIFICFILFTGQEDNTVTPSGVSSSKVLDQAPIASEETPQNSHQTFLNLAKELIKSGDTVTARDVLNDIPEDSPDYSRAKKLLKKLPEN